MEFILAIVGEIIVGGLILLPGVFIPWLLNGRKKKLKVYFNERERNSFLAGIIFWVVKITTIIYLN